MLATTTRWTPAKPSSKPRSREAKSGPKPSVAFSACKGIPPPIKVEPR